MKETMICTIKVQVFTFEDFSVAEAEELLCSKCSITLFKSLQWSSCDARITFHVIVTLLSRAVTQWWWQLGWHCTVYSL